jgi:nicotinate-nucleotide pyrophosphorylase
MEQRHLVILVSIRRALNTYRASALSAHNIEVDVDAVFCEAARALGKHPDQLTADECKAAFLNAWHQSHIPQ